MHKPIDVSKGLRKTLMWIKKGWVQGSLFKLDNGPKVCLMGGVVFSVRHVRKMFVAGRFGEDHLKASPQPKERTVVGALYDALPESSRAAAMSATPTHAEMVRAIEAWNDTPGRKHSEVIALVENARVLHEAKVAAWAKEAAAQGIEVPKELVECQSI